MSACGPHDEHCITCGDVAVEMRVVEVNDSLAVCEAEGEAREVEVALLEDGQAERTERRALGAGARTGGLTGTGRGRRVGLRGGLGRRTAGCGFAGRGHG